MAASNAYDFDLFDRRDHGSAAPKIPETEVPERKQQENNVVELDEKQLRRSRRHSVTTVKTLMNLACVLVIIGAIGAIVFSQVQLTELTDQINTVTNSLSEEKSVAIQLEMQAASKLNTEDIETIAREKLGMEKVTEGQTSYISLTQNDEGTVLQADKEPSWLDKFIGALQSLFS